MELTPAPRTAHLTIVQQVTHAHDRRPTTFNGGADLACAAERALVREITISEDETEIDLTGFESAVLIGVKNLAGTILRGPQTPEAREALLRQLIILGPEGHRDALIIRPYGHSQLLFTWPGVRWYARAASGLITAEIFAAQ